MVLSGVSGVVSSYPALIFLLSPPQVQPGDGDVIYSSVFSPYVIFRCQGTGLIDNFAYSWNIWLG